MPSQFKKQKNFHSILAIPNFVSIIVATTSIKIVLPQWFVYHHQHQWLCQCCLQFATYNQSSPILLLDLLRQIMTQHLVVHYARKVLCSFTIQNENYEINSNFS